MEKSREDWEQLVISTVKNRERMNIWLPMQDPGLRGWYRPR